MAKMIKLPSGISIDMEQGEIRTPLGPGPIPISHNTRPYITYRRSIWNRFDDFIGNIGNWFADTSETITSILSVLLLVCMAIPFIGWLVSLGWFWGIVAGIFLGGNCLLCSYDSGWHFYLDKQYRVGCYKIYILFRNILPDYVGNCWSTDWNKCHVIFQ